MLPYVPSPLPPSERVRVAWQDRPRTDYVFDFWTAFGWAVLTFGYWGLYAFYQLIRRMRDHIARRAEFFEGAVGVLAAEIERQGRQDDLTTYLDRVRSNLWILHGYTNEFRDPVMWTLLGFFTSPIAQLVGFHLLDRDIVRYQPVVASIEADVAYVMSELGHPMTAPVRTPKGPHNTAGRVVAFIFSFGIYGIWWWYDMLDDGNTFLDEGWPLEDAVSRAVQAIIGTEAA